MLGGRGVLMGDFFLELMSTRVTQEESTMDRTASAGFEGIAQMLLEQKKLMDALEAENRELRRQLADLRRGVGIAIVIEGRTIQLANDAAAAATAAMGQQSQAALQSLQSLQAAQNALPPQGPSPTYAPQNGRSNGNNQPTGTLNSDKRENNSIRSPLADSFVL
jgi:multidrug resistance efflux pump